MTVVLVELTPYDPVAGAPVTLRLSSHDDVRACLLNNQVWWPALLRKGTYGIELFDPTFSGRVTPGFGGIEFDLSCFPDAGRYVWGDKPAKVWFGEVGDAWAAFVQRFDGLSVAATSEGGRVSVPLRVNDTWFASGLLTTYAGTGGLEGGADLKGQPKPLAIGQPKYVEPVCIDRVNTVYQFHAYGPAQGVLAALENLVRFPASVGDEPTYAALVAANIPPGRFKTCLAQGLVRFGAPLTGVPSLLVQGDNGGPDGWVRTPGKVIKRLAKIAGAADAQIDAASLAALDAAVPRNLSYYATQQTTVGDLIRRIAASCNGVAGISWLSKLFVCRAVIGAPALTLKTDGSGLPQTGEPQLLEVGAPYHRLQMQADICWRPHEPNEIAFTAPLVDLGDHVLGTTYREGNIVRLPADGKRYLYTNPTPTAGNAPPNLAFWSVYETAPSASTLVGSVDYGSQVGGSKPPADATPGGNLVKDVDGQSWPGITHTGPYAGAAGQPRAYGVRVMPGQVVNWEGDRRFPCVAGKPIWIGQGVFQYGDTNGVSKLGIDWFNALGANLGGVTLPDVPGNGGAAWGIQAGWLTPPANAVEFRVTSYNTATVGIGFEITNFRVSDTQPGADITSQNTAAATATVAGRDAADLVAQADATEIVAAQAETAAGVGVALDAAINDDNKLSKAEKRSIVPQVDAWSTDIPALVANANAIGVTTEATALTAAYSGASGFLTYLQSLGGTAPNYAYRDFTTNTAMSGATYRSRLAGVRNAIATLSAAVKTKASQIAQWTGLQNRPSDAQLLNHLAGGLANLFTDPAFERATVNGQDWIAITAGLGTSAAGASDGPYKYAFGAAGFARLKTQARRVNPGDKIEAGFNHYAESGLNGSTGIYAYFYDAASNPVADGWVALESNVGKPAGWRFVSGSYQIPTTSTAALVELELWIVYNSTTGTGYARRPLAFIAPPSTKNLDTTGRAIRSRFMSTALLLGVANTVSAIATATDQGGGSGVTISIPAHIRRIADVSGAESISYNAGSGTNRAYATTYYVYADDPLLVGGAVTYQFTTNPNDLLVSGRYHVTTITTPASGGAATSGSGGSGSSRPLGSNEQIP